jgi:hypothetical protein
MALEKIWVDKTMHEPTWITLIEKFNKQREEFILSVSHRHSFGQPSVQLLTYLQATVMLSANMSLLGIQNVDTQMPSSSRSPTQIASYLSVVASIGSIIMGLLLIKSNGARLIERHKSKILGLETLAILYSLPFALLMWGYVPSAIQ